MSTPEDKIRDLEAEIVKNTARFDQAVDEGNEEDKKMYGNLITAKETRLTALLQQQSQAQSQAHEEIRDLKAKIAAYEAKLDAATTEAGEERYANLIFESKKTLNLLLQQQSPAQAQAQAGGGGQGQYELLLMKERTKQMEIELEQMRLKQRPIYSQTPSGLHTPGAIYSRSPSGLHTPVTPGGSKQKRSQEGRSSGYYYDELKQHFKALNDPNKYDIILTKYRLDIFKGSESVYSCPSDGVAVRNVYIMMSACAYEVEPFLIKLSEGYFGEDFTDGKRTLPTFLQDQTSMHLFCEM